MTIGLESDFGVLELEFGVLDGLDLFLSAAGDGLGGLESWRSSGGESAWAVSTETARADALRICCLPSVLGLKAAPRQAMQVNKHKVER